MADSIVTKTKQGWKLKAGFAVLVAGSAAMFWGLSTLREPMGFALTLLGMTTSLLAFAVTCLAVRCPSCGSKWLWVAVRSQHHKRWLHWLLQQRVCPHCGFDPEGKR
ncbi:MAG: hypothetical protein AAF436_16195 [Myxococcota bacterium]